MRNGRQRQKSNKSEKKIEDILMDKLQIEYLYYIFVGRNPYSLDTYLLKKKKKPNTITRDERHHTGNVRLLKVLFAKTLC